VLGHQPCRLLEALLRVDRDEVGRRDVDGSPVPDPEVIVPTRRSPSTIGSEPTSSAFIVLAASWIVVSLVIVVGLDVIAS
jgi:hypothetical protein